MELSNGKIAPSDANGNVEKKNQNGKDSSIKFFFFFVLVIMKITRRFSKSDDDRYFQKRKQIGEQFT